MNHSPENHVDTTEQGEPQNSGGSGDREAGTDQRIGIFKALLVGGATSCVVVLILVALTASLYGRSPAERAATSLVMPISLMWLLFLALSVTAALRRSVGLCMLYAAIWIFVGVTFNGAAAGIFLRSLEHPTEVDPAATIEQPLDAVVLLGGYAGDNRFDVPELGFDGQRLLFAAQIWHSGKTKTIICTGTGAESRRDPSILGREMLLSVGVPDSAIFESSGQNTAAEMASLKEFFSDPPSDWLSSIGIDADTLESGFKISGKIGLITNSVHLSRAMRLAKKRDLDFVPLACCLGASVDGGFTPRDLIPSASAGRQFASAFKEWLAKQVGR